MKKTHGFTLIEVLVAVLILSTSLLGLVGMQTAGMKNTVSSYNRTQATQLAQSMADRMRANVEEATKGAASAYISITPTNATAKSTCVTTTGCTSADMAENDLYEWNLDLQDTTRGLAKVGTITYAAPVFTIRVCWENITSSTTDCLSDPNAFRTDFQL